MLSDSRSNWFGITRRTARPQRQIGLRTRIMWTVGNLLMLSGIYLLLYVGGVYTQIEYNRLAARGDTDMPAPRVIVESSIPAPERQDAEPAVFTVPMIDDGQVRSSVPGPVQAAAVSTVSRIVIPSIKVDSKVVEVGWKVEEQKGQQVAVWEVAEFAVGHHKGSANPGSHNNIVLAGHVGGYGKVFKDLFYIKPGDQITIYSGGLQYLYIVTERLVLDEEGQPAEQRAANARYIEPTGSEVVTLITCWPPKGPLKYSQRVLVRALPFGTLDADAPVPGTGPSNWTMR